MSHDPTKPVRRVPEGGLQPQVATSADGAVHLVYFLGEPRRGDLFYTRSRSDNAVADLVVPDEQHGLRGRTGEPGRSRVQDLDTALKGPVSRLS